jgi:hypothetical protein
MHCCSPSHFGFVLFTPPLPSPANTTHQQPSLAPNPTHQPKQGQEVHQAGMPQIPFSTPLPLSMSAPQLEAGSDMCACVQMPLEQQPFGGALVAVSQHEHDSCKLRHVVACPHAVDEQHRPPSTPLPPPHHGMVVFVARCCPVSKGFDGVCMLTCPNMAAIA